MGLKCKHDCKVEGWSDSTNSLKIQGFHPHRPVTTPPHLRFRGGGHVSVWVCVVGGLVVSG